MSAKFRFFRFARSQVTLDLRVTALESKLAEIARKARKHEILFHTAGKMSRFA